MGKRQFYGFLGNGSTGALVSPVGSVDLLCLPSFDAPFVFGRLVDTQSGAWRVELPSGVRGKQKYIEDTGVLETVYATPGGKALFKSTDFMPWGQGRLVRIFEPLPGAEGPYDIRLLPTYDYRRAKHACKRTPKKDGLYGVKFEPDSGVPTALYSDHAIEISDAGEAAVRWDADKPAHFVFNLRPETKAPDAPLKAFCEKLKKKEIDFWRNWLKDKPYSGPHNALYRRSLIAIKQLSYEKTGALLAAGTFGIPYRLSTGLTWDFRLAWVRDGAYGAEALAEAGAYDESRAFIEFLFNVQEPAPKKPWIPLYTPDGGKESPEFTLPHLEGFVGDWPIFAGNLAITQVQHDAEGITLALVWRYVNRSGDWDFIAKWWDNIREAADWSALHWQNAENGIWESRGIIDHWTHSRIMCWTALDRAARMADRVGEKRCAARWRRTAALIKEETLRRGWSKRGQYFTMIYNLPMLCTSVLPIILTGMLESEHPKAAATMKAFEKQLVRDNLAGINFIEPTPFQLSTFWYARCLALAGRANEALPMVNRAAELSTDLDLYQEHFFTSAEAPDYGPDYLRERMLEALGNLTGLRAALSLADRLVTYQIFHNPPMQKNKRIEPPLTEAEKEFKKPCGNFPQLYSHEELVLTLKLLESDEQIEKEKALFA